MRYEQILATLIIALLAGTLGAYLVISGNKTVPQQMAWASIKTRGAMRCGYIVEPPYLTKDNSGNVAGLWYDLSQAISQRAKLDITWVASAADTWQADLQAGNFDALCSGLAATPLLAKDVLFTMPAYYRAKQPQSYAVLNDPALQSFLNVGIMTLAANGELDAMIRQHETSSAVQLLAPAVR